MPNQSAFWHIALASRSLISRPFLSFLQRPNYVTRFLINRISKHSEHKNSQSKKTHLKQSKGQQLPLNKNTHIKSVCNCWHRCEHLRANSINKMRQSDISCSVFRAGKVTHHEPDHLSYSESLWKNPHGVQPLNPQRRHLHKQISSTKSQKATVTQSVWLFWLHCWPFKLTYAPQFNPL